jgi:hypothetical protein
MGGAREHAYDCIIDPASAHVIPNGKASALDFNDFTFGMHDGLH